tara:strand:+ start:106 stop:318 length:213 start_codon:yes stop_codon:yes gene_type:complete
MKKKVKKMLDWFYQESDRGEQNISECQTIYDLVERLQYRLEDMENEHMQLIRRYATLEQKVDDLVNNLHN